MTEYALYGRVIDGVSEEPLQDGVVLVRDRRIAYVGPREGADVPPDAATIAIEGGTILPGFIDCHAHFTGGVDTLRTTHYELILRAAHGIGELLSAGFTGAREMSVFGPYLKRAVEGGYLRGPRIMPGGRLLSITGGHGDMDPNLPLPFVREQDPVSVFADGVEACLRAVREQFRIGAEFIKVLATGGVSSLADDLDDVQFSPEELRAIVEEARRHGTYVAAHCMGTSGTLAALDAGVLSVEHGVFLDERCVEKMVALDATLVPTLSVALGIRNMRDALPRHVYEKGQVCAEASLRSVELARRAGVRIALGTDFSNSKNSPYSRNGKEFVALCEAGLTPMEAIQAGTRNAAHLLRPAHELGTLEAGKLADVVVVAGDPLADISLLADAQNVRVVLKDGAVEKGAEYVQRGVAAVHP